MPTLRKIFASGKYRRNLEKFVDIPVDKGDCKADYSREIDSPGALLWEHLSDKEWAIQETPAFSAIRARMHTDRHGCSRRLFFKKNARAALKEATLGDS